MFSAPCFSVPARGRERVEEFGLFGVGDGAEVEDEAVEEYARDDRRLLAAESLVERGGRKRRVPEGEERRRRVRGRGRAAADRRLAFDHLGVERALREALAEA